MSESVHVDSLLGGDILLYRTSSLMGRAIRLLDGTEVSHAALYMGDDVAEALVREGLVERPLEESVEGCPWVAVMRHRPESETVAPVLQVARKYLDQGNRYGYEQILLLAGICLTRKVDIDSPTLRRLIQTTMRKAVDLIERLHRKGKEPMICSEFVFRTYDEALPQADDPYSLRILSQTGRLCRHFSRLRHRRGWFTDATPPEPPVVHPESLLGILESSGETAEALPAPGGFKSAMPRAEEDIEPLLEQYLAEAEGEKAAAAPPFRAHEVSKDELLDTARLLVTEMAVSAAGQDTIEKAMYASPPSDAEPATKTFAEILADFVTPGDLLLSPSLERVGTIDL